MKRLLLDTHTVIWFLKGDYSLSETAKKEILDIRNIKYVSIASIWEVAIKISLGKLVFEGGAKEFSKLLTMNCFFILPIEKNYIFELEELPYFHRDPFDRIIIASAVAENMSILTTDKNFKLYKVHCIW